MFNVSCCLVSACITFSYMDILNSKTCTRGMILSLSGAVVKQVFSDFELLILGVELSEPGFLVCWDLPGKGRSGKKRGTSFVIL